MPLALGAALLSAGAGRLPASTGASTRHVGSAPVAFLRDLFGSDSAHARDHAVTLSATHATVVFELTDREPLRLSLAGGRVLIDGREAGRYTPGGPLEQRWRRLLMDASGRSTPEAVSLLQHWNPGGLSDGESDLARALVARVRRLDAVVASLEPQAIPPAGPEGPTIDLTDLAVPERLEPALTRAAADASPTMRLTVPGGQARLGAYTIGSNESVSGPVLVLRGDANVYGRLSGNLVTVDGDVFVHPGATITGDVLALGGAVHRSGGVITGEVRTLSHAVPATAAAAPALSIGQRVMHNLVGFLGVSLILLMTGFGFAFFARSQLGIVSDTITHSFLRAFATGLLGQILLIPTFGILMAGLVLTVIGILLVPFVAVVYALLAATAVLGGFVAVAHAMGETWVRRRMASGALVASPDAFRYLATGLAAALAVWGVWAALSWSPGASRLLLAIAGLTTWFLATVGLGGVLLSRAGFREQFAGRFIPPEALTDEYLWATPQFGVPAVKRPGVRGKVPDPEQARERDR
ncbi:MAG: hypothetical protein ACOY71_01765 [Gemmatimonadota bacterium]